MGVVGCYTLDLYCDDERPVAYVGGTAEPVPLGSHDFEEFPHQYTGQTYEQCRNKALKEGWSFTYSRRKITARCPRCRKFLLEQQERKTP